MRLAKYNGNDSSPEWTVVDRYDEFGVSRFGLNYNILKVAATPVMAASSSKLYAAWSEPDNSSGKTQIRVVIESILNCKIMKNHFSNLNCLT